VGDQETILAFEENKKIKNPGAKEEKGKRRQPVTLIILSTSKLNAFFLASSR
jgi:hypothetical protein